MSKERSIQIVYINLHQRTKSEFLALQSSQRKAAVEVLGNW